MRSAHICTTGTTTRCLAATTSPARARAVQDSSMKGFGIGTEDVLKEKGGYMAAYYPAGEPEKGHEGDPQGARPQEGAWQAPEEGLVLS